MKYKQLQKGFTLVEMMVVIAILTIFTSISLVDYKNFGKRQAFVNLMYDTALDIRQVQASGIGVQEVVPGSNDFNVGYGIHFNLELANNSYLIFADKPIGGTTIRDNGYCSSVDPSCSADTQVAVHTLPTGFIIDDVCGIVDNVRTCIASGGKMDIVFARPNPDAIIRVNANLTNAEDDTQVNYDAAEINFRSPEGEERYLYIDASGQISVRSE
ncbi:MAG: prepilin-type N-terminal cleavage/methylation domain-containing protein [Patescibacteria group bacterium]